MTYCKQSSCLNSYPYRVVLILPCCRTGLFSHQVDLVLEMEGGSPVSLYIIDTIITFLHIYQVLIFNTQEKSQYVERLIHH